MYLGEADALGGVLLSEHIHAGHGLDDVAFVSNHKAYANVREDKNDRKRQEGEGIGVAVCLEELIAHKQSGRVGNGGCDKMGEVQLAFEHRAYLFYLCSVGGVHTPDIFVSVSRCRGDLLIDRNRAERPKTDSSDEYGNA